MNELMVIPLLFIISGIFFLIAWGWRHFATQRQVFQQQSTRIKTLRFNKMLEYLGIDKMQYLRKVPDTIIEQHIYRCLQCTNTDICDDCLLDRRCFIDMHFCPNYSSLIEQSHKFAK